MLYAGFHPNGRSMRGKLLLEAWKASFTVVPIYRWDCYKNPHIENRRGILESSLDLEVLVFRWIFATRLQKSYTSPYNNNRLTWNLPRNREKKLSLKMFSAVNPGQLLSRKNTTTFRAQWVLFKSFVSPQLDNYLTHCRAAVMQQHFFFWGIQWINDKIDWTVTTLNNWTERCWLNICAYRTELVQFFASSESRMIVLNSHSLNIWSDDFVHSEYSEILAIDNIYEL